MYLKFFILFILVSGCSLVDRYEYDIDPELDRYVNMFISEADQRGHNFSSKNIRVQFKDVDGAQGRTNRVLHIVFIDKNSIGYKHNPEALVFHELAHYFLKRGHDNTMYGRHPKSIMNEDVDPEWIFSGTEYRRGYYVDELFDTNKEKPDWTNE